MIGIGIDIVDVDRFRPVDIDLIDRILTGHERRYVMRLNDPAPSIAVRFAAKEATMKSLGVGLGAFSFQDVEVNRGPSGAPSLDVTGAARRIADAAGVARFLVSLSHTDSLATAMVLAE